MKTLKNRKFGCYALGALLSLTVACGEDSDSTGPDWSVTPGEAQPDPVVGQSSFVSADGRYGAADRNLNNQNNANNTNNANNSEEDGDRRAEEGDIYRVSADSGHIMNLNAYRGLQIIDFSDPSDPEIIGRVQVSGTPVEMYQVDDRLFMLINDWQGYYGARDNVAQLMPDTYNGGLVVVADVSDPTDPKITGRAQVPGYIQTSRLTRGGGQEALYVVASDEVNGGGETVVKSFRVSGQGALSAATELNLGGHVRDIQATGTRLMIARHGNQQAGSDVSIIDISDPTGAVVEGNSVMVEGIVQNKHNMNIEDDVMRIVSGNSGSSSANTNHVESFDISDIQNVTRLDHETFGDNEDLYATLFMGDRAFFVTYRRVDPFHAFHIAPDGTLTEKSEFIVSGWNDFFSPVEDQTRLIGIGKNDENGTNTMAVSLYDITDLENPSPMITREEVDLRWSESEANWDDRAFTVLEKGTNVAAPSGEIETGLVLLPFSGWDADEDRYVSAVQIFTFSQDTLTLRGVMDHGSEVRRSFVADGDADTTANLSEQELSLFKTTDPDQPDELGRVELAPNYQDFKIFGSHGVRRKNTSAHYGSWRNRGSAQETDELQVVSLSEDADAADAIVSVSIPGDSRIYKIGHKLAVVSYQRTGARDANEAHVEVYDFTNPTMPVVAGAETYGYLPHERYNYGYYADNCFRCSLGFYDTRKYDSRLTAGDALIFPELSHGEETIGTRAWTHTRPVQDEGQLDDRCFDEMTADPLECTYLEGGIFCGQMTRKDGTVEPEVCIGEINECEQTTSGERTCEAVDPSTIETVTDTGTDTEERRWFYSKLFVLDLSDPASMPAEPAIVSMASDEELAGLIARGDSAYVSYRKPFTVPGDARRFVKYFFREIGLSNPSQPAVGPDINIPGVLIEIDGSTAVTRDYLWGQTIAESSLNTLEVNSQRAVLKGFRRFEEQQVDQVMLDGVGNLLVSHRTARHVNPANPLDYEDHDRSLNLSVLDVDDSGLSLLSESEIGDWASLRAAVNSRALFAVPGGLLIVSLADATSPEAQSYYPIQGWPQSLSVEGDRLFVPAGPYGLYDLDINASNLLSASD